MAFPILATKLHIPAPPRVLVPRQRLTGRLDAGVAGKLILVSAPAGFGKSSLLAEWVNCCPDQFHHSWLHIDENDNQVDRFLTYLVAALRTHQENIGEAALSGLGSLPPVSFETALASLINEIGLIEGKLVLILDDYHQIDSPEISQGVGFLIENLPANMCLVIATRVDPSLPVHRLRARGQLTEIRAGDLRFNDPETRSLLETSLEARFSPGDIAALGERVEGWAAGLQMVALSLQGKTDVHQFIASFSGSHRFIMDYLSEEIYNQQSPDIQRFLLQTSLLDRLSGPLCDFVIGADSSAPGKVEGFASAQQVLEYLERANLFLVPLDDQRHWYRYHNLFGELLRQRLRQAWPEQVPLFLQRASTWCEEYGYPDEALNYALAAGDTVSAAQLVESYAMDALKTGALSTLSSRLDKLPEEIILERSWLSVYKCWVLLLTGKFEPLQGYLSSAEAGESRLQTSGDLRGHITAIRAYAAAMGGEIEQAFDLAHEALELLPEDNLTVRSVVIFVLGGINLVQGDIPGAVEAMQLAGDAGEMAGNIHLAVSAFSSAADLLHSQGKLLEARQLYDRALKLGSGPSGRSLPISAGAYAGLAEIFLDQDDLKAARLSAETGLDLACQWGIPETLFGCYLALAHVLSREGDQAGAQDAFMEAKQLAAAHPLSPDAGDRLAAYEEFIMHGRPDRLRPGLLVEPLSEREIDVLRLMAQGRSNPEIAAELIVALGTVKAHSSSIYRKLDVRNRTEAVLKAGELGLL